MRVLMVSPNFPTPHEPFRGTFTVEMVRELGRLVTVTVIAPVMVPLPRHKFREVRDLAAQVPHTDRIGPTLAYRPRWLDSPRFGPRVNVYLMALSVAWCTIRNRLASTDIIHGQFVYPSGYCAVLIGALLRKPVVITVHDSNIEDYAACSERDVSLAGRRVRRALRRSAHVIAVSSSQAEAVIGLGVPAERLTVVTNGVDVEKFRPMARGDARARVGLAQDGKIVLFVGALIERKGLRVLCDAVRLLEATDPRPLVCLIGDGAFRQSLTETIARDGLERHIRVVGVRPHDELPLWMNAADVLALPSFREGWPTVIFESLACGTPVVASAVGGIPEAIHSADYGTLVPAGDADRLGGALRTALNRTWDRAKLVSYARRNSWASKAQRTCEVYERVAGHPPRKGPR